MHHDTRPIRLAFAGPFGLLDLAALAVVACRATADADGADPAPETLGQAPRVVIGPDVPHDLPGERLPFRNASNDTLALFAWQHFSFLLGFGQNKAVVSPDTIHYQPGEK